MRRTLITLLCGLIFAPAAVAAVRATGDGVLELRKVNADKATVIGRGAIWGQVDSGTLKVVDRNLDDGLAPQVSGADRKALIEIDNGVLTATYIGKNIHFRFAGGRYQITIVGSGIDLTAVGVGRSWLTGSISTADAGDYAVDNGKWTAVPFFEKKIQFGTPAPVTAP
jgi:hypothetical protein